MANKFERVFYALGKGARAMKNSAEARVPGEAPPPAPPDETPGAPLALVRCPKCGTYIASGTPCTCAGS